VGGVSTGIGPNQNLICFPTVAAFAGNKGRELTGLLKKKKKKKKKKRLLTAEHNLGRKKRKEE